MGGKIDIMEVKEKRTFSRRLFFFFFFNIYLFWLHCVLAAGSSEDPGFFIVAYEISFPTRDRTGPSALRVQSLTHWATRAVPGSSYCTRNTLVKSGWWLKLGSLPFLCPMDLLGSMVKPSQNNTVRHAYDKWLILEYSYWNIMVIYMLLY